MKVEERHVTRPMSRMLLCSNKRKRIFIRVSGFTRQGQVSLKVHSSIREANKFPSLTEGYSKFPMEEQALRPLVPWLTGVHDEHFSPKWATESPGFRRRIMHTANLSSARTKLL